MIQLSARSLQKDPPRASLCQREFLRFIRPLQPAELSTGAEAWALLRRSDGSWTNEYHAVQLEGGSPPGFQCVRFTKFPARTLIERDTLPLASQSLSLSSAQAPLFPTLIQLVPVLPLRAEIVPSQQQRGAAAVRRSFALSRSARVSVTAASFLRVSHAARGGGQ